MKGEWWNVKKWFSPISQRSLMGHIIIISILIVNSLLIKNSFTCQLVSSLGNLRYVHLLLCLLSQATRSLVHSLTRLLAHLVNFFQVRREWEMVFWLLKDALLACKRCPLRPLLTPFWSLNKHLLLSCFIINWFSESYKVTRNTCFSTLFQGFYWRECQGFWHG